MSLGHVALIVVVYLLAVARVTRLVNYDRIFDPARLWVARRASNAATAAGEAEANNMPTEHISAVRRYQRWTVVSDFLACPWCVGMWAAAGTAWIPLYHPTNQVAVYLGVALAVSHLIGFGDRFVAEDLEIVDEA